MFSDVFVNFSEINWWLLALKWLPFRHTIKSVKTKVKIPPIYPTKYYLVVGYRYDATKWKWRKVVRRIISSRRVPWGVNCVWIYDVRIIPGRFQVGGTEETYSASWLSLDKPDITSSDGVYTGQLAVTGNLEGNPERYSFTMQYCNSKTNYWQKGTAPMSSIFPFPSYPSITFLLDTSLIS